MAKLHLLFKYRQYLLLSKPEQIKYRFNWLKLYEKFFNNIKNHILKLTHEEYPFDHNIFPSLQDVKHICEDHQYNNVAPKNS